MKSKPWIVCAAIKNNEVIIAGARHFDMVMQSSLEILRDNVSLGKFQQGFIDQYGNFYNRQEAMKIVKESGQPFNAKRNSEGLY